MEIYDIIIILCFYSTFNLYLNSFIFNWIKVTIMDKLTFLFFLLSSTLVIISIANLQVAA